ncbi:MAG: hypothetical protein PHE79_04585 [Eubacteriales bacterium]|nr:hypothetical protein [Eubacteriales bacterium]
MSINVFDEYFQQKKNLLDQCLRLSEELLSSLESWELLPDILNRREEVIHQLDELEKKTGKEAAASLSLEKKQELDLLTKLILELDKDCACKIHAEQQSILNSLKKNIKGQKLVQYAQVREPEQGRVLDYKK